MGADTSAREMLRLASRGLARVLREWRRDVGAPTSLQGWMDRSRASSAASARSSAVREVRNRFILTLASSWIKKNVLNNKNRENSFLMYIFTVPVLVPVPLKVPVPWTSLLSVDIKFR
jgi:hypothetical protein